MALGAGPGPVSEGLVSSAVGQAQPAGKGWLLKGGMLLVSWELWECPLFKRSEDTNVTRHSLTGEQEGALAQLPHAG